jgi:hypothetical protein
MVMSLTVEELLEVIRVECPQEPHICVVREHVPYLGVFPYRAECSVCAWTTYAPSEARAFELASRHYNDEAASDARRGRPYRTAAAGR